MNTYVYLAVIDTNSGKDIFPIGAFLKEEDAQGFCATYNRNRTNKNAQPAWVYPLEVLK